MNGPDHFRAGERLLAGQPISSDDQERGIEPGTWPPTHMELLAAQNHFLAAIAACLATSQHPESVSWEEAING